MMDDTDLQMLVRALAVASHKHRDQRRKDEDAFDQQYKKRP